MHSSHFVRSLATALLSALVLTAVHAPASAESGLTVSQAWVRLAPATLAVHGGYFTIVNEGADPQELVAASSASYEEVQIHLSSVTDGVATMQRLESVEIPAGGTVEFRPGGLHLMLMKPKVPLEEGGSVPLTLTFRSGAALDVIAQATAKAPGMETGKTGHCGHGGHHHTH